MTTTDLKGKTALITGASSGLGVAFAWQLAARGASLIITARRAAELESLAVEIRAKHAVEVSTVPLDLAVPGAAKELFDKTEGAGRVVDVLINNAGFGNHGFFVDLPWEQCARELQLNMVALTELTWRFVNAMRARAGGHVLNVSSIGAYTPSPTYATYAAGKAYVRDFTEALAYELRDSNVRVCSLCPGGTLTGFHTAAGHALPPVYRAVFMTAERCARIGLGALFAGRRNIVSGWSNMVGMWMLRFIPRRMIVWSAALSMGEPALRRAQPPRLGAGATRG